MNRVVIAETFRRHVTNVGFIVFVGLMVIFAFGASAFDRPATMWPTLVTLLALIAGSGPIGPEFSSGTLQLILVKPVTRAAYLLSRVTGVLLAVWTAAILAASCELLGRVLWRPNPPLAILGATLVNQLLAVTLIVSLLVLLGSLTRAYFNIAFYMAGMIGFAALGGILGMIRQSQNALGRFLSAHPGIERGLEVIDHNLFPDVLQRLDPTWILMVLSNAAVALVLACVVFRRREVPYGAD